MARHGIVSFLDPDTEKYNEEVGQANHKLWQAQLGKNAAYLNRGVQYAQSKNNNWSSLQTVRSNILTPQLGIQGNYLSGVETWGKAKSRLTGAGAWSHDEGVSRTRQSGRTAQTMALIDKRAALEKSFTGVDAKVALAYQTANVNFQNANMKARDALGLPPTRSRLAFHKTTNWGAVGMNAAKLAVQTAAGWSAGGPLGAAMAFGNTASGIHGGGMLGAEDMDLLYEAGNNSGFLKGLGLTGGSVTT